LFLGEVAKGIHSGSKKGNVCGGQGIREGGKLIDGSCKTGGVAKETVRMGGKGGSHRRDGVGDGRVGGGDGLEVAEGVGLMGHDGVDEGFRRGNVGYVFG